MLVNKRNIPHIKNILRSNNVIGIPVDEHITDKTYITDFMKLDDIIKNCISSIDSTISIPDVSKNIKNMTNNEAIKYDIELGKPYKFIMYKWGINRSNLDNYRNQMVNTGFKLPKRNIKEFTRLRQYNEYIRRI